MAAKLVGDPNTVMHRFMTAPDLLRQLLHFSSCLTHQLFFLLKFNTELLLWRMANSGNSNAVSVLNVACAPEWVQLRYCGVSVMHSVQLPAIAGNPQA
jgi:hypothetical protein